MNAVVVQLVIFVVFFIFFILALLSRFPLSWEQVCIAYIATARAADTLLQARSLR